MSLPIIEDEALAEMYPEPDKAFRPVGECACGIGLVSMRSWRKLTPQERDGLRAQGYRAHKGWGMCPTCCSREVRRRQPKPVRPLTKTEIVAEEWQLFVDRERSQKANVRLLAPRFGMSEAALEKAVLRAKRRGLIAA